MAYLPASGAISMSDINGVFSRGNDLNSYRGTTWYTAAGGSGTFSTGALSFSDFYDKGPTSASFSFTISSNQDRANLRSLAIAAGWSGSGAVTATINAGVYIYSSVVGTAALTINGSWPGGVTLVNNGYIMGMGGTGGGHTMVYNGSTYTPTVNYGQTAGTTAISLGISCTIQNNSYIGGGGGGGGSTIYGLNLNAGNAGGGGAGGGAGGSQYFNNNGTITNYTGGAGGGLGASGSGGGTQAGGGGGRIMPGTNITLTASSSGGSPNSVATSTGGGGGNAGSATAVLGTGSTSSIQSFPGLGGSGGGTGAVYAGIGSYTNYAQSAGGGGGYGASGGTGLSGAAAQGTGAAGGNCVSLNGYSVTWSATGTRYGAIA